MHSKLLNGCRGQSKLRVNVALTLVLSCCVGATCGTQPGTTNGCIGQSDAVLEEIARGDLPPATEAWEREVYRACRDLGSSGGIRRE